MIELYYCPTPNCQKVSIALEEMNLAYRIHPIDIVAGDQNDPSYAAICPNRKVPAMIDRGHGRVMNVASTSSFQPVPSLALYAASKAFVLSLSESLSEELKGTGVTVTALCPGITKTDMYDRVHDEYETVQSLPELFLSDVGDVAREGYEACIAGRAVVVPGLPNRLMASAVGFYPRWLVRGIGGLVGRRSTR